MGPDTLAAELSGLVRHDGTDGVPAAALPGAPAESAVARGRGVALSGPGLEPGAPLEPGPVVLLAGHLDARADADAALGTAGRSDAEVVAAAYLRYGVDGLGRLSGAFATAIWDGSARRLVLARDPSGAASLHVRRRPGQTRFHTRARALLEADEAPHLDLDTLSAWVETGRSPDRWVTGWAGIESVAPGEALVVEASGLSRRQAFVTFAPLTVPRAVDRDGAEAELADAVARSLARGRVGPEVRVLGGLASRAWLARVGAQALGLPTPLAPLPASRPEPAALEAAARLADHPLPAAALRLIAQVAAADGDVLVDAGVAPLLGGTAETIHAWVESLAGVFERQPSRRNARLVLAHARALDAALGGPVVERALLRAGRAAARRWSAAVPGAVGDRLTSLLGPPPPPLRHFERATGEPFVDVRWNAVRSRSTDALAAALRRAAALHGHRVATPFLDPEAIERAFSWPPALLLQPPLAMRVLGAGEPLARAASAEPSIRSERWRALALARLGAVGAPESDAEDDRLAGLGARLAIHGGVVADRDADEAPSRRRPRLRVVS
jgi:hypothetical protein